jgi:hypothetical protein
MTASNSRVRTLAVYVLVAFAALALPLEGSQPIHFHHGQAPGLYDGECLLATLTAFHGLAPLPSGPVSVSFGLVVGAPLVRAAGPICAPLLRHTDPRAPPFA